MTIKELIEKRAKVWEAAKSFVDTHPGTKKRYGRSWKRIRDKYVQEHPFCELCFLHGVIVPAEEVHHKQPLSEGGTHARSNLIALCKPCHSRIHAQRGDRWGHHPQGESESQIF